MNPARAFRSDLLTLALWACCTLYSGRADAQEEAEVPAVEIRFDGSTSVSERELRKVLVDDLDDVEKRGARRADVDDAAFELESYLLQKGYAHVSVRWRIDSTNRPVQVVFEVNSGTRVYWDEVEFANAREFTQAELFGLLHAERSGLLGRGDPLYVAEEYAALPGRIAGVYRSKGYLDVEVHASEVQFVDEERSRVRARVEITEHDAYEITAVLLKVEKAVADPASAEPVAEFVDPPVEWQTWIQEWIGLEYYPRRRLELRTHLIDHLREAGFTDAEVDVEETQREGRHVTLRANLRPGPRVVISSLSAAGNDTTSSRFVLDRSGLEKGHVFHESDRLEAFRRLYSTGLFQRVEIETEGSGEERPLLVRVEERDSLELFFKPGYGSYERARVEAGITERNIFGTGRRVELSGGLSQVGYWSNLMLSDPWLMNSEYRLDLPVRHWLRQEPSFTSVQSSVGLTLSRTLTPNLQGSFGYELRRSVSRNVDVTALDPTDLERLSDDATVATLRLNLVHDTRDSLFDPHRGHRASGLVEFADGALGSSLDFVRFTGAFSQHLPLRDTTVLALGLRTQFALPLAGTDLLPLTERVFNGGENSVRSFSEQDLGPKDGFGEPIGGEVANVFNVELRQDLFGAMHGALFFDAGNTVLDAHDSFRQLRYGVGAGLHYLLPIGAIRFDFAVNPDPRSDEDHFRLHLSVGMAF